MKRLTKALLTVSDCIVVVCVSLVNPAFPVQLARACRNEIERIQRASAQ